MLRLARWQRRFAQRCTLTAYTPRFRHLPDRTINGTTPMLTRRANAFSRHASNFGPLNEDLNLRRRL